MHHQHRGLSVCIIFIHHPSDCAGWRAGGCGAGGGCTLPWAEATSHSHQLSTRYRASAASLALTIHYNYDLWGKSSCATVTDAISRKRSQPSMLFCHHLLSHLWLIKGPKQYNYNRPSFSTIHFNLIKIRQCSAEAQMTSTEGHLKKNQAFASSNMSYIKYCWHTQPIKISFYYQ